MCFSMALKNANQGGGKPTPVPYTAWRALAYDTNQGGGKPRPYPIRLGSNFVCHLPTGGIQRR